MDKKSMLEYAHQMHHFTTMHKDEHPRSHFTTEDILSYNWLEEPVTLLMRTHRETGVQSVHADDNHSKCTV